MRTCNLFSRILMVAAVVVSFNVVVYAFSFPLPNCNAKMPDPDPDFCKDPFARCEDHAQQGCPMQWQCLGEYPEMVATECLDCTPCEGLHCVKCEMIEICYVIAECRWEPNENHPNGGLCTKGPVCTIHWTGKNKCITTECVIVQ